MDYPMTAQDFSAAYARLLHVFGVETQTQLAECIGVRQSSISDAKRRGCLPDGWILSAVMRKAVNPFWVLHGQGCQYLKPADDKPFLTPATTNVETGSTEELMAALLQRMSGFELRITEKESVNHAS